MNAKHAPEFPETLQTIFSALERLFAERGINGAAQLATDATVTLADTVGGLQIYIPKGNATKTHLRNVEIFKKSGKVKASQLAREYGISAQQVHYIIKQESVRNRRPL
jgi:Mor family transcriptional regulator